MSCQLIVAVILNEGCAGLRLEGKKKTQQNHQNTVKTMPLTDFHLHIEAHIAHNDSFYLTGLWNRDVWESFN